MSLLRPLLFLFILLSCGKKSGQPVPATTDSTKVDSLAVLNDPKNNLNIQTNSFSEIDSSGILMFPLSMRESSREGFEYSYKSMPASTYWNIIFLNSFTNEYHMLSEKKMLINSYDMKYSNADPVRMSHTNNYIFYSITTDDLNKDKKLSRDDPAYLFVTDKKGYGFRQISPSGYNLLGWQFIKSSGKLLMTLKRDSDNNKEFDEKDEVTTFETEIDKGTAPREVFSTDFKNRLKILFDRDWRRKE